jgi:hypothetical protein
VPCSFISRCQRYRRNILSPSSAVNLETVCFSGTLASAYESTRRQNPNHQHKWVRPGRPGDQGSLPGRGERIFPLACVQTGSGAHPASCTVGTGGSYPGGVTLTAHPHLVPRSRVSRSYIFTPPSASVAYSGTALAVQYLHILIFSVLENVDMYGCAFGIKY